ncbi:MAG: hypothetical protein A2X53_22785 [Candidatus Rokubacteria bacterium GWA2_70_23]|nr:MAG: hypothetical protein A2X53_22785 [Candidatus Rokubacteria bacterium GWA2_70_23]
MLAPDGTICRASAEGAGALGYTSQDLIGKSLALLLHPDDVAGARRVLEAGTATPGFAAAFEARLRHRDGSWRRFSILGISGLEEPDPAGIIVYCRDITASEPAEEAARVLMDVQRELVETLDPAKVPGRIVSSMLWLFRCRRAVLYHVDPESGGLVCAATAGATDPARWIGETLPPGAGAGGRAVAEGRPVRSADLLSDPATPLPDWLQARLREEGCPVAAAAPMIGRGEMLGAIVLHDAPGRDFTDGDLRLLAAFADQAALACQNARLYRKAEQRAERLANLHSLVKSLGEASGMRATLEAVAEAAAVAVGARAAGVFVADPEARALRVRATSGIGEEIQREAPRPVVIGYGEGLTGRVFESRTPEYVEDLGADARGALRLFAMRAGFRAYAGLPLVVQGTAVGVLTVVFGESRRIEDEEKELLELLAGHAAIALRKAQVAEESRAALERSEASEERFRLLLEELDAIVWEADAATENLVILSPGAATALSPGGEPVSSLTELCERFVHPDDRQRTLAFLRMAAAEGTGAAAEHRLLAADGRVFWVLHRVVVGGDAEGRVRRLRGLLVDITGEKRVEQRQRLQATVTRVLAAAPTLSTAIPPVLRAVCELAGWDLGELWLIDKDAGVLARDYMWSIPALEADDFGAAGAAMIFAPGTGLPGRSWVEGKAIWVPDVAADPGFVRKALAARLGLHAAFAFPIRARGEVTGVMLFLSRDVRPPDPMLLEVVADLGEHIGQFAERKRVEEALAQSQEMLRQAQKMEGLGRLAGGVAHDFNNLLTVIIGRGALLQSALDESSALRRNADIVHETALRAAALTRQLLAFSRQQKLQPRVLDLSQLLSGLEEMLRRLIREDIELAVPRTSGLWRVRADPTQLEQVIVNLAVNARDAMPEGGRLTIRAANVELNGAIAAQHPGARPGAFVLLEVADTGVGMSPDVQARIFEPFFTTKEMGRGTGLGLATVYGIVRQHEGWIEVRSQPGRGTTFAVYLPRVEDPADADEARPAHRERLTGSETILLAEDEDEVRSVVREMLESLGYRVIVAGGPAEALERIERLPEPIHLLLTDVVMPGMRGPELARRATELRPALKVLYISGHADDTVFRNAVIPRGMVILEKPFTPESLAVRVREVLDRPA